MQIKKKQLMHLIRESIHDVLSEMVEDVQLEQKVDATLGHSGALRRLIVNELESYADNFAEDDFIDEDEDGKHAIIPPAPKLDLYDLFDDTPFIAVLETLDAPVFDTVGALVSRIIDELWPDVCEEARVQAADRASFGRDPYMYNGVRQSDFY